MYTVSCNLNLSYSKAIDEARPSLTNMHVTTCVVSIKMVCTIVNNMAAAMMLQNVNNNVLQYLSASSLQLATAVSSVRACTIG